MSDGGGELSSLKAQGISIFKQRDNYKHTFGKTGAEQTRNLLNKGLRRQESVVLLGELLNKLLVLVKPGDFRSASVI